MCYVIIRKPFQYSSPSFKLSSISLMLHFSAIRRNGRGKGRKKRQLTKKTKPSPCTECGQEVNFTLQLKKDEECPGRLESGWVPDVLLCLLETHVGKWSLERATPMRCEAAKRPARREHRQKKN